MIGQRPAYANTLEESRALARLLARARAGHPAVDPGYSTAVADVLAWISGEAPAPALDVLLGRRS